MTRHRQGDNEGRAIDLAGRSVTELFQLHRSSLLKLYERGIVRTMSSPQGDWAELLVATAYAGQRAPNSEKSWDVMTTALTL